MTLKAGHEDGDTNKNLLKGRQIGKTKARRLRSFLESTVVTCLIFLLGICFRGEWMLILVHFTKHLGNELTASDALPSSSEDGNSLVGNDSSPSQSISKAADWLRLATPYLEQQLGPVFLAALATSGSFYFAVCGILHWYFYVCQRNNPEDWKCQPYKWLSAEMERREIALGMLSLLCTNIITAIFATYLMNDGWCLVYYRCDEYTWLWWFLQWPVLYIIIDYLTYWFHRLYHWPTLFKLFHKAHHSWKQPTAWSATAIHPVEIVHLQLLYILLFFIIPIHLVPYLTIMVYNFYHGMIDHSGINFKAQWWQPWQPDVFFHDNHHQYTHVNFGFNMFIWDKLHGTYRQKNRIYNEHVFYGKGKDISEATKEELEADIRERTSEHIHNKNIYCLSKEIANKNDHSLICNDKYL